MTSLKNVLTEANKVKETVKFQKCSNGVFLFAKRLIYRRLYVKCRGTLFHTTNNGEIVI